MTYLNNAAIVYSHTIQQWYQFFILRININACTGHTAGHVGAMQWIPDIEKDLFCHCKSWNLFHVAHSWWHKTAAAACKGKAEHAWFYDPCLYDDSVWCASVRLLWRRLVAELWASLLKPKSREKCLHFVMLTNSIFATIWNYHAISLQIVLLETSLTCLQTQNPRVGELALYLVYADARAASAKEGLRK